MLICLIRNAPDAKSFDLRRKLQSRRLILKLHIVRAFTLIVYVEMRCERCIKCKNCSFKILLFERTVGAAVDR